MPIAAEHATPAVALPLPAQRALSILAGTLFVAACAHVAIPLPFTPVPMTLQPFAVLLVGLLLGPTLGAATMVAYLFEGAAGLPVFTTQGSGGMLQLLGPTGGYLLSYPAAAGVSGLLARSSRSMLRSLLATFAASLLILLAGACWLSIVTHQPTAAIYRAAVLPFLPGDALKAVLAALIATAWFHRAHTRPAL